MISVLLTSRVTGLKQADIGLTFSELLHYECKCKLMLLCVQQLMNPHNLVFIKKENQPNNIKLFVPLQPELIFNEANCRVWKFVVPSYQVTVHMHVCLLLSPCGRFY